MNSNRSAECWNRCLPIEPMSHGAIGVQGHATIRKAVDAALAKLKAQIRQIDTRNYLEARKFSEQPRLRGQFCVGGMEQTWLVPSVASDRG